MAQKTLLMILDGWGNAPDPKVSALDQAHTPILILCIKTTHQIH
jgi:2,3-bisphosphoglycerate-independent phosphoglycerate mutase